MTDPAGGHTAVAPAPCATAQAEVDVLVVEEVALVEEADVAEEPRPQQDGASGEELDVAYDVVLRPVELAVCHVGAGPVATERDAEAVHDVGSVASLGEQQLRLRSADSRVGELVHQRREPPWLDLD